MLANGVRGEAPATEIFSCILEVPDGLPYNLILLSFKLWVRQLLGVQYQRWTRGHKNNYGVNFSSNYSLKLHDLHDKNSANLPERTM